MDHNMGQLIVQALMGMAEGKPKRPDHKRKSVDGYQLAQTPKEQESDGGRHAIIEAFKSCQ